MPEIVPVAWEAGTPLSAESRATLRRAADILLRGGLVAIPTETVYGLAAVATDAAAVARIFAAKGRPASNPLIVHVSGVDMLRPLVATWPEEAERVTAHHWPGPLTVVVPASDAVPDVVRAGGTTVALRSPEHPVTASLLAILGKPLAAPSANRSGLISPTTAAHVAASLGDAVDLILDGGTCDCGIESTVLDLSGAVPRVLRPGPLDRQTLEVSLHGSIEGPEATSSTVARSPGLLPRHYAPKAELELATDGRERVHTLLAADKRVGWITRGAVATTATAASASKGQLHHLSLPDDPAGYARHLYASLHALDDLGVEAIVVDRPPGDEAWHAVQDRLTRASYRE
jgi:L-threonylcarbamoyladenylate synthase